MAYFANDDEDVGAKIAQLCIARGYFIGEQDRYHVRCSKSLDGFGGVLAQALLAPRNATQLQQVAHFAISRVKDYAVVQAMQWAETQTAFGQIQRTELNNKAQETRMMDALLSAGGSRVPPAPAQKVPVNPSPDLPSAPPASSPVAQQPTVGNNSVQCVTC